MQERQRYYMSKFGLTSLEVTTLNEREKTYRFHARFVYKGYEYTQNFGVVGQKCAIDGASPRRCRRARALLSSTMAPAGYTNCSATVKFPAYTLRGTRESFEYYLLW